MLNGPLAASHTPGAGPQHLEELRQTVPGVPLDQMPHMTFTRLAPTTRGAVRTGDAVAWANLIPADVS